MFILLFIFIKSEFEEATRSEKRIFEFEYWDTETNADYNRLPKKERGNKPYRRASWEAETTPDDNRWPYKYRGNKQPVYIWAARGAEKTPGHHRWPKKDTGTICKYM